MKSASKLPHLENSLSVEIKRKAQRSPRSTNRHILKLIKRRRGGRQTRVLLPVQESRLNIKHRHEPRVGGLIHKRLKS